MKTKQLSYIVGICLVVLLVLISCSSSSGDEKLPREVNSEESSVFSRILVVNKEQKNARFTISPAKEIKTNFEANGYVDLENRLASIDVELKDSNSSIQAISKDLTVFEKYSGLSDLMVTAQLTPRTWVERPIDKKTFGVDSIMQFVMSLTADFADNPILLKQDGAQFLGTQEFKGEQINLFKKSEGDIIYYVTNESLLVATSLKLEGFTDSILISFSDHRSKPLEAPSKDDIYQIENVSSFYITNRPNF